ncbi:MAG: hypothetical protein ACYDFT_05970 [Thermoplasmata archaeon]
MALASHLTQSGVPTIVMERASKFDGEDDISLFDRLSAEADAWRVYWPLGGRLTGKSFELGYLAKSLLQRELTIHQLSLFPEKGVFRWNVEEDRFEVGERGNRTPYFTSILARQPPILQWSDYVTLFRKALRFGTDLVNG